MKIEQANKLINKHENEDIPKITSQLEQINKHLTEFNVMNFGFDDTGEKDNSDKLNELISFVANNGGGIVKFPEGKFKLLNTIVCKPNVYLKGNMPWRGKGESGYTVIECYSLNSPQFLLREYCSLESFYFTYPNQELSNSNTPIKYEWTIATDTNYLCDDIQLKDIFLNNSYKGINLTRGGRFNLRNIYGQPIYKGLLIDNSRDMNYIERIEFWTFTYYVGTEMYKHILQNGTAFDFKTVDGVNCNNLFAYGYRTGFYLDGSVWATFIGCCTDKCFSPIKVDSCNIVEFLGGAFIGDKFNSIICNIKNVGNSFKMIGSNFFGGNGIGVINRSDNGKILIDCNFKADGDNIKIPVINMGNAEVVIRKNRNKDVVLGSCSVDGVPTISEDSILVKTLNKSDFGFTSTDITEITNGFRIDLGKIASGEKTFNGNYRIDDKQDIPLGYYYLEMELNGKFSTDRKRMNISIKKDDGSKSFNSLLKVFPFVDETTIVRIPFYLGEKIYITVLNLFISYYDETVPTGDYIDITNIKLFKMGNKILNSTIENAYKNSYTGNNRINYNLNS